MKKLNVGVIGIGGRGLWLTKLLCNMASEPEFKNMLAVAAVCDLHFERAAAAVRAVNEILGYEPKLFTEEDSFFDCAGLDAAIIATSWETHAPLAVKAMRRGIRPGLECGGASSLEQCFELVRVSEETRVPCMFLENCNYGREEMALQNMCEQGVFGELIHMQCGYQHDLRDYLAGCYESGHFRLAHHIHRNAELYPMHGLGPMMKMLKINEGNRITTLVSVSSKARGINEYAKNNYAEDHPLRTENVSQGDVVNTFLKCQNGETVLITHDSTLPRPYSRAGRVQGTKGIWMEDNRSIHIEGMSPPEAWEPFDGFVERNGFEHPVWKEYLSSGVKEGHGGMDYLVVREFVRSAISGAEPPIGVYDAALFMSVTPLSARSISLGSHPVEVPDFTNGKYMKLNESGIKTAAVRDVKY